MHAVLGMMVLSFFDYFLKKTQICKKEASMSVLMIPCYGPVSLAADDLTSA